MHDSVLMQIGHPRSSRSKPGFNIVVFQTILICFQHIPQRRAGNILHHNPALAFTCGSDIPKRDQVNVLHVQTLTHTPQLNIQITLNFFQRDLFTCVIKRKVNFTKSADTNPAFDGVSFERSRSTGISKLHSAPPNHAGWLH